MQTMNTRPARRRRRLMSLGVTGVLAAGAATMPLLPNAGGAGSTGPDPQADLEHALLEAVRGSDFANVIDYGPVELCPGGDACPLPARTAANVPNIDLAVIELDADGYATRAANVLLSRDYPSGIAVPIDSGAGPAGSYGVSSVRWRAWDIERADGGAFDEETGAKISTKGWADNPARTAADDIIAGRANAPIEFMAPYPASLFKLIIAFRIMRLVDEGRVTLADPVPPRPAPPTPPAPAPEPPAPPTTTTTTPPTTTPPTTTPPTTTPPAPEPTTTTTPTPAPAPADTTTTSASPAEGLQASSVSARDHSEVEVHGSGRSLHAAATDSTSEDAAPTVAEAMDAMMTISDNESARGLLRLLTKLGDIGPMNAELASLGLGTLQITGTNPETGGNWQPGQIHMTAMDTARLLWLIDGGSGALWARPNDGAPVAASLLSADSRNYLLKLLDEQAYHEALSTTSLCNADNIEPGIPAQQPARWINSNGVVNADGYDYATDVRRCNAEAQVNFGHKTGLTWNYGADGGIVTSLPGKGGRHYMIVMLSSLGYRYTDKAFARRTNHTPCDDATRPICYTQRIPAMAAKIDEFLAKSAPA